MNYDAYTLNRLVELLKVTISSESLGNLSKLYSWRARLLVDVAVKILFGWGGWWWGLFVCFL